MPFKKVYINDLLQELTTDKIIINRLFCKFMGNTLSGGVFLTQLICWCDEEGNSSIYKTTKQWEEATLLSWYKINESRKYLENLGILVTKNIKHEGNSTVHYKLLKTKFIEELTNYAHSL